MLLWTLGCMYLFKLVLFFFFYILFFLIFILFILFIYLFIFYFTILYWFCHTLTWVCHGCTWVPNPEPCFHLPPHIISLDHPCAPAPSILIYCIEHRLAIHFLPDSIHLTNRPTMITSISWGKILLTKCCWIFLYTYCFINLL